MPWRCDEDDDCGDGAVSEGIISSDEQECRKY